MCVPPIPFAAGACDKRNMHKSTPDERLVTRAAVLALRRLPSHAARRIVLQAHVELAQIQALGLLLEDCLVDVRRGTAKDDKEEEDIECGICGDDQDEDVEEWRDEIADDKKSAHVEPSNVKPRQVNKHSVEDPDKLNGRSGGFRL